MCNGCKDCIKQQKITNNMRDVVDQLSKVNLKISFLKCCFESANSVSLSGSETQGLSLLIEELGTDVEASERMVERLTA